ncbi:MAG TPA: hypothetical protein VJP85_15280 [Candidatus Baltobacteraceae bacterium]|nr:hypothetical protein [Candidatus Baltobacteraceae bacterium]
MKRCLLVLALPALLAAAPTPLVVGSVRDQYGLPIEGARVSAAGTSAQTDAQGTFALEASNVRRVTIACPYCRTVTLTVRPDEPVVALVQRYDALAQEAPSQRDVASVPYSHAESIAALRPFTVLENTTHALPGPQLSDRGAFSRGALVLDNGIPLYDVASNQSPFVAFPAYALQRVSWIPPSDAFTYGDLAGGGTLAADTQSSDSWSGISALGGTSALRTGQTRDRAAWSLAASAQADDRRERADAFFRTPIGDDALDVSAIVAQDRYTPGVQELNTSDDGLRAAYTSVRRNRVSASLIADGGSYYGSTPNIDYSARWSDVQAEGGVATTTRIQFFTDLGVRASSGDYWTSGTALPRAGGTIAQTHLDMGAQTAGERYSAKLGFGVFDAHYAGGASGSKTTLDGGMLAPSFSGSYALDPHWTLDVQAAESFALPTVLEAFVYPPETPGLAFDRNAFLAQTLAYADLRRFRASVTMLSERVRGLDVGTIHSLGVSAAWQIAPVLALRAWILRDNDRTAPYDSVYRFGARPQPATLASYWLTYESSGLRIDAIYRRDLLDYRTDPHVDASASAPIAPGWRLFGATEQRAGRRTVSFGLRAQTP